MELKIEITPVKLFEIKIDGESLGEFKKDSEWEGMIKFKKDSGEVIVANDDSRSTNNFISNLFKGVFDSEDSAELSVVKISPSLIPINKESVFPNPSCRFSDTEFTRKVNERSLLLCGHVLNTTGGCAEEYCPLKSDANDKGNFDI